MSSVLIAFSSVDGQTLKICRFIADCLEREGDSATLVAIDGKETIQVQAFDKVIVGASIRYGKHRREVYEFIRRHRLALDDRPSAFFSVNVVARKTGKDSPETNPYMKGFKARTTWRPSIAAVFAGRISYPKYGIVDREVIRLIMWLTHGPTDRRSDTEFTRWERVETFAKQIGGVSAA